MGMPTARPTIMAVLLPESDESTPLVTTLDEVTPKPAMFELLLILEDRELEAAVVEVAEVVVVVPEPLATTEPSAILVKVMRSTSVVLSPMACKRKVTRASITSKTSAGVFALRVIEKPTLMLL